MSPTATPQAAPPTPPAAPPDAPEPPPRPAPRPLRNGNPRGNPNLAPRCGAKARTTGCPCRAPAMPNGRCRMHGGNCRGPSTPEGRAAMTAANTRHGKFAAHVRIEQHYVRVVTSRNRLICTARRLWPYLPPDMAARLGEGPQEFFPPAHPSNLPFVAPPDAMPCNVKTPHPALPDAMPCNVKTRPTTQAAARRRKPAPAPTGRAAERLAVRAEAAAQAPWREAIAQARVARRAILQARAAWRRNKAARRNAIQSDNAAGDQRATDAPAAPPTLAWLLANWQDLTPAQRERAFRLAGLRGPSCGQPQTDAAPAPQAEPTHVRTKSPGCNAMQREPAAHPAGARPPTAPPSAPPAPTRPKPSAPAASHTAAARPEPLAPDPVPQAPLNRAARRRLKYLQRRRA